MTDFLKFKWYRSILLALFALLICLGLGNLNQQPTQATNPPNLPSEPIEVAETAWRYGSFPVENFQSYTSAFGYRLSPVDGQRQFHNGLDMAAPIGSYVRNWWTGKIIQVSDHTACGTSVIVQSGPWQHAYCHLEGHVETGAKGSYLIDRNGGLQIWQGQEVPVGSRIGRVGMTGRTTGPHLHWALKYNGNYIDPALVLKEMFKQQA
ncbi:Peptidase M23 [Stanieria sp. NIES-3757]|nr:Peptidase M23 [Stanieria sp. NIES-3757]